MQVIISIITKSVALKCKLNGDTWYKASLLVLLVLLGHMSVHLSSSNIMFSISMKHHLVSVRHWTVADDLTLILCSFALTLAAALQDVQFAKWNCIHIAKDEFRGFIWWINVVPGYVPGIKIKAAELGSFGKITATTDIENKIICLQVQQKPVGFTMWTRN